MPWSMFKVQIGTIYIFLRNKNYQWPRFDGSHLLSLHYCWSLNIKFLWNLFIQFYSEHLHKWTDRLPDIEFLICLKILVVSCKPSISNVWWSMMICIKFLWLAPNLEVLLLYGESPILLKYQCTFFRTFKKYFRKQKLCNNFYEH